MERGEDHDGIKAAAESTAEVIILTTSSTVKVASNININSQNETNTKTPLDTRDAVVTDTTCGLEASTSPTTCATGTSTVPKPPPIYVPMSSPVLAETDAPLTISKNQLKKKRRWDKLMEIKKRRKLQDKQVKLERAKVQGRNIKEEQAVQEAARIKGENRCKRRQEWERIQAPRIAQTFQVCLDCAFEAQMTRKEINSLALQIRYCYSLNKRHTHPCQLTATSIDSLQSTGNNHSSAVTLELLKNVSGFEEWTNWAFAMTPQSLEYHYASQLDNVVYLTSDSDEVLHDLDASKIYVIGAIVDRNRLQRATLNRAAALGVATARLPIDEHLAAMASTKVLTVNHVFELLLEYRQCHDWKRALLTVLPSRKDAKSGVGNGAEETTLKNELNSDDNNDQDVKPS